MISELVVTAPNGVERPDVSVDSADVHVTRRPYRDCHRPDSSTLTGESVTLKSSVGKIHIDTPRRRRRRQLHVDVQDRARPEPDRDGTRRTPRGSRRRSRSNSTSRTRPTKAVALHPKPKTVRHEHVAVVQVFATDPDKLDRIKLGSSGLPRSVKLTQTSNNTGIVMGIVTAKPGTYHVTFTASDGKNPPTKKALTIKVKPNQLKVAVNKTVHVSGGRPPVVLPGCASVDPQLQGDGARQRQVGWQRDRIDRSTRKEIAHRQCWAERKNAAQDQQLKARCAGHDPHRRDQVWIDSPG